MGALWRPGADHRLRDRRPGGRFYRFPLVSSTESKYTHVDAYDKVAAKWGVEPHLCDLIDHKVVCRDLGHESLTMDWKDAVHHAMTVRGGDEFVGIGSYYHRTNNQQFQGKPSNYAPSYVFSTGACHVNVDMETGKVDIDEFFFAHDCGRALNKRAVEAQLEGSIYSGLGYAMYEELKLKDGRMLNPNFRDYRMITALDMPKITTKFDYTPDPEGPSSVPRSAARALPPPLPPRWPTPSIWPRASTSTSCPWTPSASGA